MLSFLLFLYFTILPVKSRLLMKKMRIKVRFREIMELPEEVVP